MSLKKEDFYSLAEMFYWLTSQKQVLLNFVFLEDYDSIFLVYHFSASLKYLADNCSRNLAIWHIADIAEYLKTVVILQCPADF